MATAQEKHDLALKVLKDNFPIANHLKFYLSQIQDSQDVEVEIPGMAESKKEIVVIPRKEAWTLITAWLSDSGSNLSMPERGSTAFRAGKLIESIEYTQTTKRTADAVRTALRNQVTDKTEKIPLPVFNSFQKAMASQDDFYRQYNDSLLHPLTLKIADSPLLAYLSPGLRKVVASQLVANWPNYLRPEKRDELTVGKDIDEIAHLIIHSATPERNRLAHLINSDTGEVQIREILDTIEQDVKSHYKREGGGFDAKTAAADATKFAEFSLVGATLSNVSHEIHGITASGVTDEVKNQLDRAVRAQIVIAAKGQHQSAEDIITGALDALKLPATGDTSARDILIRQLLPFNAQIEATEIAIRSRYMGSGFFEGRNHRLLATDFIAETLGVDPFVPWLNQKDIDAAETALQTQFGSKESIETILNREMTRPGADPKRINELFDFLDRRRSYAEYLDARKSGSYSLTRESFGKTVANFQSFSEPYAKFYRKTWDKIEKVDDFIRSPQRRLAEALDNFKDRFTVRIGKYNVPIFGLGGFLADRWVDFEKRMAAGVFRFARSGNRTHSFVWRGIGNYSKAFYQSDASFAHTNFKLLEKGWGNVLDWAAQRVGQGTWAELRKSVGDYAIKVGMKFAPGLTAKIVELVGVGTSELGIGLLLLAGKILWEVGKSTIGAVARFFGTVFHGKADNLYGAAPLFIGGVLASINAVLLGIPAALIFTGKILWEVAKFLWDSIVALFLLAASVAFLIVVVSVLLFSAFKTTINLDSGISQLLTSIICDSSTQTTSDPTANVALCIAKYAKECPGLNPMTKAAVNGSSWQCLVAGLVFKEAVTELKLSADSQNWEQCVGLSAASAAGAKVPFSTGQKNACTYAHTQLPKGYRYISGTGGMKPGDHFLMGVDHCLDQGGDTVGHIGVVIDPGSEQKFTCVDANYTADGLIRGPESCFFAKSEISGYLRKM